MATALSFQQKAETFGFDTDTPWALPALRLLFAVPRAYQPLVEAWNQHNPSTKRSINKLVKLGFIDYQGPIVINTRSGQSAAKKLSPLPRYKITSKGLRLLETEVHEGNALKKEFPKLTADNLEGVINLLGAFNLVKASAKIGISGPHAIELSGLAERTGRWWVQHLLEKKLIRQLAHKEADVREIIPEHWRITKQLCKQLRVVFSEFPETTKGLASEFRIKRSNFQEDIDTSAARIGIVGATDYDHDIIAQKILATLLRSSKSVPNGILSVEPRIFLKTNTYAKPYEFVKTGKSTVYYQPDAEMRERSNEGLIVRSLIEYERNQSRRDAWSHIERFLGYIRLESTPLEPAVLRFIVDTPSRVRSYVELLEAFTDYAIDNTDRIPLNEITIAVSCVEWLNEAEDPLKETNWYRIRLPKGSAETENMIIPVLHKENDSPYDDYFSREV